MCSLPNHGLQSRVQDGKGTQTGMHRSQNVNIKFMLLVGTQLISYQLKVQSHPEGEGGKVDLSQIVP